MVNITKSGQVDIEFGNGDILISSGRLETGEGLVILSNQEPHEIGETSEKFKGKQVYVYDNPEIQTIITFSKIESIDVFISELQNAKAEMERIKGRVNKWLK